MSNFKVSARRKIYFSLLYQQQDALEHHPQDEQDDRLPPCKLQWRQGQLLVRLSQDVKQISLLPSLENQQWLVNCLNHSPVQLVRIDATLGEAALKRWATACQQAKKPVFLRGMVVQKRTEKPSKLSWCIKLIDWIAALGLLMVLSPIMLAIAVLQMYLYSPRAIFSKEWCVGARGKLFQAFEFRTTKVNRKSRTTSLGHWMCKYNIDKLPQLFNIVRGEMSLFGRRPLNLSDAVRIAPETPILPKAATRQWLADGLVA